jgi:release factor glutamine methyltransferase
MSDGTWTVRRLLEWTPGFLQKKGVDQPRLSAELLLAHVLNVPRIKLYTDFERILDDKSLATYREFIRRAVEDEPIAYLTGKAHFFNLEFTVTRDVLIPRPDTETLVENVLQTVRHQSGLESARVLDLCTGSGCIAAAIAKNLKAATVVATDISEPAVQVARKNIEQLGLADRVIVELGDLYDPISRLVDPRPFDLIVANPPYIPTNQLETLDKSVRDFEPLSALDGGIDGLIIHRRILQKATEHLTATGRVFLEIAFDQGPAALEMAASYDAFEEVRLLKDYGGRDRVLALRRRPVPPI